MNTNDDIIVASVGSRMNSLVFRLGQYEGTKTLDIRKYFYSKKEKEFLPTRKGISLSGKTYKL